VLGFNLPGGKRLLGENHILLVHLPSVVSEGEKPDCTDLGGMQQSCWKVVIMICVISGFPI
jgi:hypothetical protein